MEAIKCMICGKEFVPTNKSRKLCSDECREENRKKHNKAQQMERKEHTRALLGTRFCEMCGKEFSPRNSLIVTCSVECTKERRRIEYKLGRKEAKEKLREETKKKKKNQLAKCNKKALDAGTSYGKLELKSYLAKQSEEMAKHRRELDAEWERRRKDGK